MNERPKPQAVVFDLDGVYFEQGTERFIEALHERYHLDIEAIKNVYLRSPQMRAYKTGKISGDEFWNYAIQTWGIQATPQELLEFLGESYEENTEVVQLVRKLRKEGVKVAVCTNNFPERINVLNERFGLRDEFDVFVTSYEEGVLKPEDGIFHALAQQLALPPSRIVMSDDKSENVMALQRLGFHAFLYQGLQDFKERIGQ